MEAGEGITARRRGRSPLSRGAREGKDIPTYYDQPALKPSFYGWKVSGYMFVAGIAGSAQIIAAAAEFAGGETYGATVRNARYIALAGSAIGAGLLILDLHTPQRFYNMLRIFRPTSPMSIGSYVLTGFGGLSALLAAAQLRRDLAGPSAGIDRAATVAQVPAALLGAAMSTYTGALLSATSTPLWAALPRLLPALFGVSAMSSAAAALSLLPHGTEGEALHRIEKIAAAVEVALIASLPATLRAEGVRTPTGLGPALLAAAVPLADTGIRAVAGRDSGARPPPALIAGIALGGALLLRHLILRAGNRSAQRPRDHFRFARPR